MEIFISDHHSILQQTLQETAEMTGYRKLYWIQETLRDVYQFRQDVDHYWKAANAQILSLAIGRRQDDDKMVSDQFGRDQGVFNNNNFWTDPPPNLIFRVEMGWGTGHFAERGPKYP